MGVTGLWTVVQPCARPIKIETLNRKRLAVDASIWIYQFLKAVRDKEGNALRNSHVVGFFRRICKLLFFGIKPVFVFDGGAPALKRQTINGRKQRREGRREDAVRTAGKLLALQMQRRAEEEEQKRKQAELPPALREEEEVPDNPVYAEELMMTQKERDQNRRFKKKDQYHLPDLDLSLAEMGQPNDPRVMSLEELEAYARQFDTGEDINVYDFSKIDFNSPFFQSLPATDRYNILNAARLRSRLRMGYSKDQLEDMFPDRMAFSRFQIERVKERNELTQRLMHLSGMTDDAMPGVDGSGRIAGEKGREYVLVKNAGVEGGWALGVIGDKDSGERNKPIDVDQIDEKPKVEEEDSEEDMGFEDVPIEGLNRLPKVPQPKSKVSTSDIMRRREALHNSRTSGPTKATKRKPNVAPVSAPVQDQESLFIQQDSSQTKEVPAGDEDEQAELQRAIAMSLENVDRSSSPDDDDFEEVFQERRQEPTAPFKNGIGSVAEIANGASRRAGANVVSGPFQHDDEEGSDGMQTPAPYQETQDDTPTPSAAEVRRPTKALEPSAPVPKFDGPLPFESLDLGSSLLGKKKMKKIEQSQAGGFEKDYDKEKKKSAPIPPWFSGDVQEDLEAQKATEAADRARERRLREQEEFEFEDQPKLRRQPTSEVIDVDAIDEKKPGDDNVIAIDSDIEEEAGGSSQAISDRSSKMLMDDVAEMSRTNPPQGDSAPAATVPESEKDISPQPTKSSPEPVSKPPALEDPVEEAFEWEDSDHEEAVAARKFTQQSPSPTRPSITLQSERTRSESIEFEDVDMRVDSTQQPATPPPLPEEDSIDQSGLPDPSAPAALDSDDEQVYSDDEDDELMLQLATETEEHARFASQLNNKDVRHNIEEYERELKALRSQQKKDRRDADEVTHVMITECQQLLKLFGLPYITAPMEAEAQCAELVRLGLVDGIVTDDSDIFLFGGTRIYKNMFNQAKFVECYLSSDLEREFDLTRDKMIRIAHLLGSDYTVGLPGIGPVTALEIISEFPDGLADFKTWWTGVQMGEPASDEDAASAFRRKFRRNSTKLFLPNLFPDLRVDQAYLEPEVDSDPSAFQWGVPDLDALRSFLMATIGWSQERTDEVLVPVVRDINRRENEGTQANITSFIGGAVGAGAFAPRRRDGGKSKRMETALEKLAVRARERKQEAAKRSLNGHDDEHVDDELAIVAKPGSAVEESVGGKRQGKKKRKTTHKRVSFVGSGGESEGEGDGDVPEKQKRPRKSKKSVTFA